MEISNKTRISYSSYSTWKNCPHQWKLTYLDKAFKSKPSIEGVFGSAIHTVIQKYVKMMHEKDVKSADALDLEGMLKSEMRNEYSKGLTRNDNKHFSNSEELAMYYLDGVAILQWFKDNRKDIFQKKDWTLVGIEVPVAIVLDENRTPCVEFFGFIDLILLNTKTNTLWVYDIKTSGKGWPKFVKDDKVKTSQLILYKEFLSKKMNVDPDDIEIEYLIFKRIIDEESEWPNMKRRLQRVTPASGKITRKKVLDDVVEFVILNYDESGNIKTDVERPAISGKSENNCRFCQAKDNYQLCPLEKRIKTE